MGETTTINITRSLKDTLAVKKVHPNQSYDEVILNLIEEHSRMKKHLEFLGAKIGDKDGDETKS